MSYYLKRMSIVMVYSLTKSEYVSQQPLNLTRKKPTMYHNITRSASARCWEGDGYDALGPNCVIAKDIKSCTYCCYVRCVVVVIV